MFQLHNTKCLWLVNDFVTNMNSDNMLFSSIGLYPIYSAGIPNSLKEIHFCVLCSEKLNYTDNVEKCFVGKGFNVNYKPHGRNKLRLSFTSGTIALSFEATRFPKLPYQSVIFQSILKKICLSLLAFVVVCINKRVTYITNEVLT